jgi:hypothetical protein
MSKPHERANLCRSVPFTRSDDEHGDGRSPSPDTARFLIRPPASIRGRAALMSSSRPDLSERRSARRPRSSSLIMAGIR